MALSPSRPGKVERRRYYRGLKDSFSSLQYEGWNRALGVRLVDEAARIPAGSLVAVYRARAKEADLSSLFSLPLRFCFPKVLSLDGQMEFRLVEGSLGGAGEFEEGAFGILEPTARAPVVAKADIHTCFVPLLAFDAGGRRLGHGRGFYDRFLDGFGGARVGVGFEWQFSPEALPVESCDQPLHRVITESDVRVFAGR